MVLLPWIILFLPLVAAAAIVISTCHDDKLSAGISIGAVVGVFILSIIYIGGNGWETVRESAVTWLSVGDFHVDFGVRLDPLALLMMLVVTGVASVIHIYSWGYMNGDPGFSRFFACL